MGAGWIERLYLSRRLWRRLAWAALVLVLLGRSASLCAQLGDDWKFDVVRLKDGRHFSGLLLEETRHEIRFQCVRRNPGAPTVVIYTTFQPKEVTTIEKLDASERAHLAARIKALDPAGKAESLRMENLRLTSVPWITEGTGEALSYPSSYFVLVSNARADIVRRAGVRLEQLYAAYARFLPPRRNAARPTTIFLVHSLAEYHGLLKDEGHDMDNPAFFDIERNRIMCACDLQRLGEELQRASTQHAQWLQQLQEEEAELNKLYRGKVPPAMLRRNHDDRLRIIQAQHNNDARFHLATRQLFQTLYHEACHAYLANFVYPPGEADVPRWLNEGLAQIFETAIVEAGELRVGHADKERLHRLQARDGAAEFVPLTELLKAGPRQFVVAHGSDQEVSNRHYLCSWALTFYLTFDRKLLGTPALDRYVRVVKEGAAPVAAFEELVGEPLPRFEKEFHQYALSLHPEGVAR